MVDDDEVYDDLPHEDGYVHEAGRPVDERLRRRRAAVLASALTLLLAVVLVIVVAFSRGWIGGSSPAPTAAPTSCAPAPAAPAPETITVNVYNSTDRAGLARKAATALTGQKFTVAAVKNDPLGRKLTSIGEVRHGASGAAAAQVLAQRFPGAALVQDARTDASVDIALGSAFTAAAPAPSTAPAAPAC